MSGFLSKNSSDLRRGKNQNRQKQKNRRDDAKIKNETQVIGDYQQYKIFDQPQYSDGKSSVEMKNDQPNPEHIPENVPKINIEKLEEKTLKSEEKSTDE